LPAGHRGTAATARRPNAPAYGTVDEAADGLRVDALHERGLTGTDVAVAIVDAGLSLDRLTELGRRHPFDADLSYAAPQAERTPGAFAPGHGTVTAFQVGVAAPDATLLDHATVLRREEHTGLMEAWLSDIAPGYERLRDHLVATDPGRRRLVISNSWALIDPEWDFEGERNYSDNPDHVFCKLVRQLVELGADVLFAAGNCGDPYPDQGCALKHQPICGANSLPEVITVGAVDLDDERLGYSAQGPGRLALEKPDLCAYSHYRGSGIPTADSPDWGTSVACPLVAGMVAAIRTRLSAAELSPVELRDALNDSARRAAGTNHDADRGYGTADARGLIERLGL